MKPKNRWPDAHLKLKRLYDERVPQGMRQSDFGKKYDIGTQGMVWQYLSGYRPLNYEVAAKFAKGLACTIYDISPEMAESLNEEILPFLGKALRRAAMLATVALLPALFPQPSDAHVTPASDRGANCVLCKVLRRWLRCAFLHLMPHFRRIGIANL
jgi:transcriptional regulator with XRE-family HTH domain